MISGPSRNPVLHISLILPSIITLVSKILGYIIDLYDLNIPFTFELDFFKLNKLIGTISSLFLVDTLRPRYPKNMYKIADIKAPR